MLNTRRFRDALGQFPTGVTIVTTVTAGGDRLGMTISSFNSLSLDPPLVLFSIWRKANSFVAWQQAKHYAINLLSESQEELSNKFARAQNEKWIGQTVLASKSGLPLLPNAVIAFECEAYDRHDGGTTRSSLDAWSSSMKIRPNAATRLYSSAASIGGWALLRRMRQLTLSICCTDGEAHGRLEKARNPLLRSGVSQTGEVPSARFLILNFHAARNLYPLGLRRAGAVQAFGQIADSVAANGHVLDQPQDAHAVRNLDAVAPLQELAD